MGLVQWPFCLSRTFPSLPFKCCSELDTQTGCAQCSPPPVRMYFTSALMQGVCLETIRKARSRTERSSVIWPPSFHDPGHWTPFRNPSHVIWPNTSSKQCAGAVGYLPGVSFELSVTLQPVPSISNGSTACSLGHVSPSQTCEYAVLVMFSTGLSRSSVYSRRISNSLTLIYQGKSRPHQSQRLANAVLGVFRRRVFSVTAIVIVYTGN